MARPSDYNEHIADLICERMVEIYALCDPDTKEIRYIGKANNAKTRFTGHLWYSTRRKTPLYSWIRKLESFDKKPLLRILEVVPYSEWKATEKRLIADYRKTSRLLNLADGGDEPYCPREVRVANGKKNAAKYFTKESRSANGKKNAKALHADPMRKRWWHLVRSISTDLSHYERGVGYGSEEGHKAIILNCIAMSELFPNTIPPAWHNVRWHFDRWGDLSLEIIKQHMRPSLFDRLDFTGVYQ
jgi:hypothetical protein